MTRYRGFIFFVILSTGLCRAEVDVRNTTLELAEKVGLGEWLKAPVKVSLTEGGIIAVHDEGVYFFQYDLQTPQGSAEPNVIMSSFVLPETADKAVFITHGWIDKAQNDWPERMAGVIRQKTDPNEWVCGFFGWSGGSGVMSSIQAAQYARDIGGPRLAAAILKLPGSFRHIHFVGHSAGSWVINSAAKRIVEEHPGISLHLTFLDAYVPQSWEANELSSVKPAGGIWAEHYYTRDITYTVTQQDLAHAHNVDITAIDPLIAEHEFPYRWYLATIIGSYGRWDEKGQEVFKECGGIEYGFARSLEAGKGNWMKTESLLLGKTAIKLEKKKP
jgi:hypothetical protein